MGITRSVLIRLATKRNIPVDETTLTRFDLYDADEAFISGTGEIVPVVDIDSCPIGTGKPGPITKQLMADFREFARNYRE